MDIRTSEKKYTRKNGILRLILVMISFMLEIGLWWMLVSSLHDYAKWVNVLLRLLAIVVVLILYSQRRTSSMKMPWIMLIMAFPVFGLFLYCTLGHSIHTLKMKRKYELLNTELRPLLPADSNSIAELRRMDPAAANIATYLGRNTCFPLYQNSSIEYFSSAEAALESQLEELAKAEEFIFMEYHAIEHAQSWRRIESVLRDRVRHGVEVRVLYDDMGSIVFINTDFARTLERKGIRCAVFNPFRFGLNVFLNNRDHRKITVIDGKVGFTGGYNLADEYFNITHPYGAWKDSGVKISGAAVNSLTVSFLEMWNAVQKKEYDVFDGYLTDPDVNTQKSGFIAPYADNPIDGVRVGEDVYINILAKANTYCWFMTPYLILSDETISALTEAAMRGVDVRIVTPGIPDKKVVYQATRSFYPPLVKAGVRIYEWTPGFCHAKMCIADGTMATCGTINLDYRSLYHHFENGCFFSHCDAIRDVKTDFERTFRECEEVTDQYLDSGAFLSLWQLVLRLFAGLL